jgi:2-succinyl-5-enolpyruvyl-6-hydroxy-3-cyclohexene-1-carboxylate synthase
VTTKADFTSEEWDVVLEGPPSAGMIVITAQRGGTIRETLSIGKAYTEARQQHGQSELLDEITAAKPEIDHTRYHTPEELRDHALQHIRDAVALLEGKAQQDELEQYRSFVVSLAERVARAHSEGGEPVSEAEQVALEAIKGALG